MCLVFLDILLVLFSSLLNICPYFLPMSTIIASDHNNWTYLFYFFVVYRGTSGFVGLSRSGYAEFIRFKLVLWFRNCHKWQLSKLTVRLNNLNVDLAKLHYKGQAYLVSISEKKKNHLVLKAVTNDSCQMWKFA